MSSLRYGLKLMVYDKISELFVSSVMFFWLNLSFMYTENLPWCKILSKGQMLRLRSHYVSQ